LRGINCGGDQTPERAEVEGQEGQCSWEQSSHGPPQRGGRIKREVIAEEEEVELLNTTVRQLYYKMTSRGDQGLGLEDGTGKGKHE